MSSPSSGGAPSPSPSPAPSDQCSTVVGGYCYNVISTSQFTTSLWLSAAAGGLILLTFIYIRGTRTWRPVLHKRATQICDLLYRPPPLGLSGWSRIWSWLSPVFLLSDEDLLLTAGLDALTLVRFIQMGMHIFLVSTIIGCAVLLPLYRTGGDIYSGRTTANSDELMLWTLSNVFPGSSRLWAAWACMIAFTLYVCWVLWIHSHSHAVLLVLHDHRFSLLTPQISTISAKQGQKRPAMWLVGRPEVTGAMTRLWNSILCLVSPISMLNSDIRMIKSRIQAYEKHYMASKADSGNDMKCDDGENKVCLSKAADVDVDANVDVDADPTPPTPVQPWWLRPEDIPAKINSCLIPGGLALGKSPAENRAKIASMTGSLVPTAAYVVLFRATLRRNMDLFWNDFISIQRRIAADELDSAETTEAWSVCDKMSGMNPAGQDLEGALKQTLSSYFPTSFQEVVPVYKHKKTDIAIQNLDEVSAQLAGVQRHISRLSNVQQASGSGSQHQHQHHDHASDRDLEDGKKIQSMPKESNSSSKSSARGCLCCRRSHRHDKRLQKLLAKRDALESKLIEAEKAVIECRKNDLANPLGTAYFALFTSQRDAVFAVRANVAEGLGFTAETAPGPDDVNWNGGLWARVQEQAFRKTLSILAMTVFILFPIGALTGALANLQLALCGGTSDTNNLYSSWFCGSNNGSGFVKILLTGLLPVAISTLWDTWVSPMFFYLSLQSQRCHASLSSLDIDATKGFYAFALINTFIEAVLGGAFIQQVGSATARGKVASLFGTALPAASNFFLNYIGVHALFTNPFRFIWPHDGTVLFVFFRAIGLHRPQCERDEWIIRSPPSYRGARHFGSFLAIYIMSMSYAMIAPIILPIALMFFFTAYISWRYAAFHFYEPCYEGGGKMWSLIFELMVITLWIANVFAGCVFIAKSGFWIGGSLIIVISIFLAFFRRVCVVTEDSMSPGFHRGGGPRSTFWAPPAKVPRDLYLPPPLREGAVGWYPEWGKLWEKYAIPRYTM